MGKNKELGLPFGDRMEKWALAFDIDGTLINEAGDPYPDIVMMLITFSRFKNVKTVVWSGGGKDYADRRVHELDIQEYVDIIASKTEWQEIRQRFADHVIAIDDIQDTRMGLANLIVRNK